MGSKGSCERGQPRTSRPGAAVAVVVAVMLSAVGVVPAGTGLAVPAPGPGTASAGWLSTTTTTTNTTLRDVRTIINAASGTAGGLTGAGVGIAMVDTGLAPVPGLPAAQLVNGPDLSFESQSSTLRYLDTFGHGTHMAGIMVANDTATGTVGLSPKAKITSVKVGQADGAADVSQMIAAIDWVVANKNHDAAYPIRVLNLSYASGGTPPSTSDPLQYAVEQAWKAGIVVVVAAGNDGNSTTALTNPATDPFVVAVGASSTRGTTGTADDELASFTNLSTSRSPDVLAPGDGIVSLRDQGSNIDETYPTARVGETLFRGSGTSQTAPVVSAAVALLLQNRPSLTPDQVKRLLIDTGTPIRVGIGATKGLKEIDVGAAVAKSTPGTSQTWTASKGAGSIEAARGDVHVVRDNVALTGDKSIFGPFSSTTWAAKAAQRTAWSGGAWMGNRMAGDSWTGQWAGPSGSVATGQISGLNGWCVDVENGSDISGSQIQLYPCNNTPAQYVTLQPDSTLQVMGKCVNVKNNATANGSMLVLWDCDGRSSEKWAVNADRELKNPTSSRCIDASSTSKTSTNGTPLQIRDCNKTTAQRWMPPFASKTWGAATWTGKPWSGAGSWVDPSWSGTYWTGRYWSGRFWSGRYWSGRYWSSGGWSAARWG